MPARGDSEHKVIEAALELAAERGWNRVGLADIADRAAIPLDRLHGLFGSKQALLSAFARMIDRKVLAARDPELADEPARERLFAVMMARFDALRPYREGLRAVLEAAACDPAALFCGAAQLALSMAWMLEAAGLSSSGVKGALRVKGLAAIQLATLRVWFSDESEDMAATMAALDRHLRRAERLALVFEGRSPRAPRGDEQAAPAPS